MYRHILVATDGEKFSRKAVATAIKLAAALGARLAAVHVIPPYRSPLYSEGVTFERRSDERYRALRKRRGTRVLDAVARSARAAGVACSGTLLAAEQPWRGILAAAKTKKCDLVVMASHGRRGLAALLLGSEAAKVLTHSAIPVLVCRS